MPPVVQGEDRRILGQFTPDSMPAWETYQHREVSPVAWMLESFWSPWQLFSWASISLGHLPHLRHPAETASMLGSKQG